MTADEAIELYMEHFGWFPSYILAGFDNERIIKEIMRCIETGKDLVFYYPDDDSWE